MSKRFNNRLDRALEASGAVIDTILAPSFREAQELGSRVRTEDLTVDDAIRLGARR